MFIREKQGVLIIFFISFILLKLTTKMVSAISLIQMVKKGLVGCFLFLILTYYVAVAISLRFSLFKKKIRDLRNKNIHIYI